MNLNNDFETIEKTEHKCTQKKILVTEDKEFSGFSDVEWDRDFGKLAN